MQRTAIIQRMSERAARQASLFDDPMLRIGERQLEHIFCQIHSDSRSMHGGLLSFGYLNAEHPVWHFDADIPESRCRYTGEKSPFNHSADRCESARCKLKLIRGSGRLAQAFGLMESISSVGRWVVRFDREETIRRYALLPTGTGCSCTECTNFNTAGRRAFPDDFQKIAEELGIDVQKPAELCHYSKEPTGLHLTGGWFHIVGSLESGGEAWKETTVPSTRTADFEKLSSGAGIGFSLEAQLVADAFKGAPLVQIEFPTHVPWVLSRDIEP